MKILLISKYNYLRGGAEKVFLQSQKLLEDAGHEVVVFAMKHPKNNFSKYEKYFTDFSDTDNIKILSGLGAFLKSIYSFDTARKLNQLIKDEKPDIAHIHFFDQLSSTILRVLKKNKIPIIETSHDYKLVCPHYYLNKDGIKCPKGILAHFFQTIFRKRHRNSYLASIGVAIPWLINKITRVYDNIDIVITPAQFSADKLVMYGVDKNKIRVIHNFVSVTADFEKQNREYVLFAGRLSEEKGIRILEKIAKSLPNILFKVAGVGDAKFFNLENVEMLGYKNQEELQKLYERAKVFLFPSIWDEVCPMVLLEAGVEKVPVVASDVGGVSEIVKDGQSGYLFNPNTEEGIAKAIKMIENIFSDELLVENLGNFGKNWVFKNYSEKQHKEKLEEVYFDQIKG